MANDKQPLFEDPKPLQDYYNSLESRIGYKLILGDTRHFGYWKNDTKFPFPLTPRLREMEDHLYSKLNLKEGSMVLDGGCGVGHVALHLAEKGLNVHGIDLIEHHLRKARRNIARANMQSKVTVEKGNYQEIKATDGSYDGLYTMETFVHATDPKKAIKEFYRVLRPGGKVALFEYDHTSIEKELKPIAQATSASTSFAILPAGEALEQGVLEEMLEEVGFVDVLVEDYTPHITPMLRFFFMLAYVPYMIVRFLHLEKYFINTVSGYCAYKGRHEWRYIVVTARKPEVGQD